MTGRPFVLASVIALALTAVMTAPTITHPASFTRMDSDDGLFGVWNVAWVAHAMLDADARLFDANIFHPHTGTLAYSEPNVVAGWLATPAYALTGHPVASFNVAVYLALVIAFLATWQLVWRFTQHQAAAVTAATAFTFSAYVAAHTAHVQLLMVFGVPVGLLGLHRFVEQPGVRRGAALGTCLALAGLACAYYGVATGLAIGLGALWFAGRHLRSPGYWGGLLIAVLVATTLTVPFALPFAALRRDTGFKSTVDVSELQAYSADFRAYLRGHHAVLSSLLSDDVVAAMTAAIGRNGEVLFPGLLVVMAALAGALPRRRDAETARSLRGPPRSVTLFYVLVALMLGWASFGPRAGLYSVLVEIVPFISFLRAPARFGVVVLLALAVLAGFGVARLATGRRAALGWVIAALVSVELYVPWPLRPVPPVPEAYQRLATLPRAAVLKLQFPYKSGEFFPHARYMFWSTWHWQPIINGYSDYIPPDFREIAVPINGFPNDASLALLRERGARYVTIDWRTYSDEAAAIMRARFPPYRSRLRVHVEAPDVSLYEIIAWPE